MRSSESSRDKIIGLEVGGRVFYCHRSTLTNEEGSYFAARFDPDSMMSPGEAYTDERGRQVYFIDRDPDAFPYITQYLRTKKVPGLPKFEKNPELWRQLREEAEFFCLERLSSLLKVTYSCSPEHNDQGILHWLGTRRGTAEYKNPFRIGAVHVGGSVDDLSSKQGVRDNGDYGLSREAVGGSPAGRASFVQYRPETSRVGSENPVDLSSHQVAFYFMPWCCIFHKDCTAFVDLKDVQVHPTHYSIRASDCFGMITAWNLEASHDCQSWDVIHEGREKDYIEFRTEDGRCEELTAARDRVAEVLEIEGEEEEDEENYEFAKRAAEHDLRRTWKVRDSDDSDAFYRFFRIRKVGDDCLHGTGLELFGDVFEN